MANKCCGSAHCLHESKVFKDDDETVTVGKKTYHTDCWETQEQIAKVCDLFYRKINNNVVFGNLRSIVNEIVYIRGISPDVLYFGINYYLNNHIPLNYPAGLFYVIQNKKMLAAYNKTKVKKLNYKFEVETTDTGSKYQYNPQTKNSGFSSILS